MEYGIRINLGALTVLVACYFIKSWISSFGSRIHLPMVGSRKDKDFRSALEQGSAKYPDTPFMIPTPHAPTVILPLRFINEIKGLPEAKLSKDQDFYGRLKGEYTGAHLSETLINSVKSDLTKNIAGTLVDLQDEMDHALQSHWDEFAGQSNWTPVTVYKKVLPTIALLAGRVFVGIPLNRNPEWVQAAIQYPMDMFMGGYKFWAFPRMLHPILRFFLREVKSVRKIRREVERLLRPKIEQRLSMMKMPGVKPPQDMIQFLMTNSGKGVNDSAHDHAAYQAPSHLMTSVASLHSTSLATAHTIIDLAAHPELIEPLREEIERELAESDGVLKAANFARMWKLDSVMKESQRFNPPSLTSMNFRVVQPLRLSNGTVLPTGSYVGAYAHAIDKDPTLWSEPEVFDGFRFAKLRSVAGNESKYQYVTTGLDNSLAFGHGTHACPGRFFAANEIKVLLVNLLRKYDLKLADVARGRPENHYFDVAIMLDMETQVLFKSRKERS